MSDSNNVERILDGETEEALLRTRNAEISNILKLRVIDKELRRLRVTEIEGLHEGEGANIQRALDYLSIYEYIHSDEKDDDLSVLNLRGSIEPPNLSYRERKFLREQLVKKLQKQLQNISHFSQKLRKNLPEVFLDNAIGIDKNNILNMSSTSAVAACASGGEILPVSSQSEIISLEKQRHDNAQKLGTLLNRKCGLLKAAAELKTGPYFANEMEILYTQARLNYSKANLLHAFFVQELITRTEHSVEAIKEVARYVDDAVETEEK